MPPVNRSGAARTLAIGVGLLIAAAANGQLRSATWNVSRSGGRQTTDIQQDGSGDFKDINPFVDCPTTGHCR